MFAADETVTRWSDARTPTAGSSSYVQNGSTTQPSGQFQYISGDGVVGGSLGIGVNSPTFQAAGLSIRRAAGLRANKRPAAFGRILPAATETFASTPTGSLAGRGGFWITLGPATLRQTARQNIVNGTISGDGSGITNATAGLRLKRH